MASMQSSLKICILGKTTQYTYHATVPQIVQKYANDTENLQFWYAILKLLLGGSEIGGAELHRAILRNVMAASHSQEDKGKREEALGFSMKREELKASSSTNWSIWCWWPLRGLSSFWGCTVCKLTVYQKWAHWYTTCIWGPIQSKKTFQRGAQNCTQSVFAETFLIAYSDSWKMFFLTTQTRISGTTWRKIHQSTFTAPWRCAERQERNGTCT